MKFTSTVKTLRTAMAHGRCCCPKVSKIPILRCLLLEAAEGQVAISGHNLNCSSTGTAAADVVVPGAVAIGIDRLRTLLESLAGTDEVTFESGHGAVVAHCGGSHWRLPASMSDDFPTLLAARDPIVEFELAGGDVCTLFGLAAGAAISRDETRLHLCGLFLHADATGNLATVSTDGIALVLSRTGVAGAGRLPVNGTTPGILLPPQARAEILALGRVEGCRLRFGGGIVEARAGNSIFASKLVDSLFPDFGRIIPPAPAASIEVDVDEFLAALSRLMAASTHPIGPVVGLVWNEGVDAGAVHLELVQEPDAADDKISAVVHGNAAIAFAAKRLDELIFALCLDRVRIGAATPARVEPVDNKSTPLALLATAAWPRSTAQEAA